MPLKYRRKRIYLNEGHTKYCVVRLYLNKLNMQTDYEKFSPGDDGHYLVEGVHCGYEKLSVKPGCATVLKGETGTVFLHLKACGAGVVCHELGHAVLWAHKHRLHKKQYPIVIKNMADEEEILYHLTYAIRQFYTWYWEAKKKFK